MTPIWPMLALVLLGFYQDNPVPNPQLAIQEQAKLERERHRQAAIQINELAGRIHTVADAAAFVDTLADFFADTLPLTWATRSVRQRVPLRNTKLFRIRYS